MSEAGEEGSSKNPFRMYALPPAAPGPPVLLLLPPPFVPATDIPPEFYEPDKVFAAPDPTALLMFVFTS